MFISKEEPGGAISGDQLTNNLIATETLSLNAQTPQAYGTQPCRSELDNHIKEGQK